MPQQNSNDINQHWTDYENLVRTGQEFRITVKDGIFSTKNLGHLSCFMMMSTYYNTISSKFIKSNKREYRIDMFIE